MSFAIRVFQIAKAGSKPDECEDALSFDPRRRLFAIADGATDSAFQRLWAGLLVKRFIEHPPDFSSKPSNTKEWFVKWLRAQQDEWDRNIQWDTLSWSGYNKARMTGGLATFLGVYFFPDKPRWKAIAFGDCNLFQFRVGLGLYYWGPLLYSEEFGSNPVALSSINPNSQPILEHMAEMIGDYEKGDIFILATDALSAWLTHVIWQNDNDILFTRVEKLLKVKTSEDFNNLIDQLRFDKEVKNDDTSVIIIEICNAPLEKASDS